MPHSPTSNGSLAFTTIPLDLAHLQGLGAALSVLLDVGDVVTLQGTLGAGKTSLVRAMIHARMGPEIEVTSPSFTLLHHYPGSVCLSPDCPRPVYDLYHYDFYRLDSAEEIQELGLEDAVTSGISFIEWPEIATKLLPKSTLALMLEICDEENREITIQGDATWSVRLAAVQEKYGQKQQ